MFPTWHLHRNSSLIRLDAPAISMFLKKRAVILLHVCTTCIRLKTNRITRQLYHYTIMRILEQMLVLGGLSVFSPDPLRPLKEILRMCDLLCALLAGMFLSRQNMLKWRGVGDFVKKKGENINFLKKIMNCQNIYQFLDKT